MSPEEQAELLQFLDKSSDVFPWSTSYLLGLSREVIKHKLQVNPHAKPKKQKLYKMLVPWLKGWHGYLMRRRQPESSSVTMTSDVR
jgi:hypothetical protein